MACMGRRETYTSLDNVLTVQNIIDAQWRLKGKAAKTVINNKTRKLVQMDSYILKSIKVREFQKQLSQIR